MPPHHLTRSTDKALRTAIKRSGIRPIEYWHKSVATCRQSWCRFALGMHALRGLLGQLSQPHTNDSLSRVLRRSTRMGGSDTRLSKHGENELAHRGHGHTVCAVGEKVR